MTKKKDSTRAKHKGLDDVLAAGDKPKRIRGDEVKEFLAKVEPKVKGKAKAKAEEPEEEAPVPAPSLTRPRPPFPLRVLPERIADYVNRVAEAVGSPVDFPALAVLTASGVAFGASRELEAKPGFRESGNLYAATVGDPGSGKTPAFKAVFRPLFDRQVHLIQEHRRQVAAFRDAEEAVAAGDEPGQKPRRPLPPDHLYVSDTTTEAVALRLESNPNGIVLVRDELSAWIAGFNAYRSGKGGDAKFFLEAWSRTDAKVDRKHEDNGPVLARAPFLSVFGGVQPDVLPELCPKKGKNDGFLCRWLFAYPEERPIAKWTDVGITDTDTEDWTDIFEALLSCRVSQADVEAGVPMTKVFSFSADGRAAWVKLHDAHVEQSNTDNFNADLKDVWIKMKTYALRFALILHMLRVACGEADDVGDGGEVDECDVNAAWELVEYFKAHYEAVFQTMSNTAEQKRAKQLVAWMRRKGLTTVTVRDVYRAQVAQIRTNSDAAVVFRTAADLRFGEITVQAKNSIEFTLTS